MRRFEVEFREWRSTTTFVDADDSGNALYLANRAYDEGEVGFKDGIAGLTITVVGCGIASEREIEDAVEILKGQVGRLGAALCREQQENLELRAEIARLRDAG